MNLAIAATREAYDKLLFREALKAAAYDLGNARDVYRWVGGVERMEWLWLCAGAGAGAGDTSVGSVELFSCGLLVWLLTPLYTQLLTYRNARGHAHTAHTNTDTSTQI